jgi:hypothetical protein
MGVQPRKPTGGNLLREAVAAPPPERLYFWRVRTRLPERFGTACRVLARGALNSALVQFLDDGLTVITSRNFFRRAPPGEPKAPRARTSAREQIVTKGRNDE